jgi:hypothetical protein
MAQDPRTLSQLGEELHGDLAQLAVALHKLDPQAGADVTGLLAEIGKVVTAVHASGIAQVQTRGDAPEPPHGAERDLHALVADTANNMFKLVAGLHLDGDVPADHPALQVLAQSADALGEMADYLSEQDDAAAAPIADRPSGDPADSDRLGAGIESMVERPAAGPNHNEVFDLLDKEGAQARDLRASAAASINAARVVPKVYRAGDRAKPYKPRGTYHGTKEELAARRKASGR